ncbi:MAG TPA: glycosyltransferase family 2 protein [Gemmatimonadota bacterium]|jgi:glycosyltransferase involved in cell wall biosynthesis
MELSVVIPCLNECETLSTCIEKAQRSIQALGTSGEIIVADNGSTDGSIEIAGRAGARVVHVRNRGYGQALMGGIEASKGRYIIMADADDSYDFLDIPRFMERLREGFELVQGCRLPSGGGTILPGAMPLLHRWGNPFLSSIARRWFRAPVHDVYCGMRGFSRRLYDALDLRCTGMELAVEMIVKASIRNSRIAEVPITLYPDGRISHAPHLRTFRDGWRTLRLFLLSSPYWLFFLPGAGLAALGIIGYAIALPGLRIFGVSFDAHTLLFASLAILLGYQATLFSVIARVFAVTERLLPETPWLRSLRKRVTLERGLVLGLVLALVGVGLLTVAVAQWWAVDFGDLDYARTMRWVIPGATLTALGFETMLASFLLSVITMNRR